jgi:hypothetical protein
MAQVNLWVYEPAQLIKIVINHDPMHVNQVRLPPYYACTLNISQNNLPIQDRVGHISECVTFSGKRKKGGNDNKK